MCITKRKSISSNINAIIEVFVENLAAINEASNVIKDTINQEFHKVKSKLKSINRNRYHVPKAKSNQEIKVVRRYETLYPDYESSETEDTSSDRKSEMSTNTSSSFIQKILKRKKKSHMNKNKQI